MNATILPLLFLSGVFIAIEPTSPVWVRAIGSTFPVRHLAEAMLASFYGAPFAFEWHDVMMVAAWGVAGLLAAAKTFSWEPRW